MPPPPPSNIRAFVHWKEPSIYAGEDIECIITFRNVAAYPGQELQEEDEPQTPYSNGFSRAPSAVASRRSSLAQSSVQASWAPSFSSSRQAPNGRGHRPALSLNVLSTSSRGGLPSAGLHSAPMPGRTPTSARPVKGHGRSLSIMSLGSEAPSEGRQTMPPPANKRPARVTQEVQACRSLRSLLRFQRRTSLADQVHSDNLRHCTSLSRLQEHEMNLHLFNHQDDGPVQSLPISPHVVTGGVQAQ